MRGFFSRFFREKSEFFFLRSGTFVELLDGKTVGGDGMKSLVTE